MKLIKRLAEFGKSLISEWRSASVAARAVLPPGDLTAMKVGACMGTRPFGFNFLREAWIVDRALMLNQIKRKSAPFNKLRSLRCLSRAQGYILKKNLPTAQCVKYFSAGGAPPPPPPPPDDDEFYYKLALQRRKDTVKLEYSLHGLWVQDAEGKRYYAPARSTKTLSREDIPEELYQKLCQLWPSFKKKKKAFRFWKAQWLNHGKFAFDDPIAYLQTTVDMFGGLPKDMGLSPGEKPAEEIGQELKATLKKYMGHGAIPELYCVLDQNNNLCLEEIRICTRTSRVPIDCPVLYSGDIKSPTDIVHIY